MSLRNHVVAIVDDDPRLLESMQDLLESAGYRVRSFSSGQALIAGGLSGVQLLITDIGMPGMDGFELRDRVQMMRPGLPVYLITGRHELADQDRARGAQEFFRKPFDARALLAAMAKTLSDRETENEHEG